MILLKALGLAAAVAGPTVASAQAQKVALDEMKLDPSPVEGVSSAFVAGAMDAEGAFGANSMMREGSVFPPHSHPDARMSLVLEGTMYLGTGDAIDAGAEQVFEAGTVAIMPEGVSHWMAARDGDVRILEIGTGPTTTEWTE